MSVRRVEASGVARRHHVRAPGLRHRLEYLLLTALTAAGRRLSDDAAARIGEVIGRLGYRPLGIRCRVVEDNLRLAFPDRDEAWIRETARATYAHFGREFMAMLRLAGSSREEVLARTEVEGIDALRRALDAGRGVVLVTGHLGNWEIGGASLAARGIPLDAVAQRQANPLFDQAINAARERLGMGLIERSRAPRLALRALRAGRVVAFVADQDARRAGFFVPFFGRPASTHRGPAVLALRAGAPLFFASVYRGPDGRYYGRTEEVLVERDGPADEVAYRLTAAFTARLEAAIQRAPEQYFWFHRRWKTRPPEEPPPGLVGTILDRRPHAGGA